MIKDYFGIAFEEVCDFFEVRKESKEDVYTYLTALYTQSYRKYHNIDHINAGLIHLKDYTDNNVISKETELAIKTAWLWHDSVYYAGGPMAKNNERDSACLMESMLCQMGASKEKIEGYDALILDAVCATRHDGNAFSIADEIICDIDLADLGCESFWENNKKIRQEYNHLTDSEFIAGNHGFMAKLLERPCLFYTNYFYDKYENKARENIRRLIEKV